MAVQSAACRSLNATFDRARRLARALDVTDPRAGDQFRADVEAAIEQVVATRTGTGTGIRASGGAR